MTKAGSILASENCSKKTIKERIKIVAAILIAATFIVFSNFKEASASILVEGLPLWQSTLAEQSLKAVHDSMPTGQRADYQAEILQTVASRLFSGYKIDTSAGEGDNITVQFSPEGEITPWNVEVRTPQLQNPPLEWFSEDVQYLRGETMILLQGVPLESLSWSDKALQEEIEKLAGTKLPGWAPSLLLTTKDERHLLTITFAPQMPMILAVNPTLVSNSLPTLLHGELREGLMGQFAPFIGIPVIWASKHSADMSRWAEDYINERRITERSASKAEAEFQPSQISQLNVRVESRYYTIGAWAAIYAGTADKSAELGVHIGRKVELFPEVDMEAYAEGILGLQEWNINGRFGLRWRSIRDFWIGGEWDTKDEMMWGKLSMDPQLRKPYFWLRFREDGKFNGAIGWRTTENISFEVEYDARDNDRWSLKMLGNL